MKSDPHEVISRARTKLSLMHKLGCAAVGARVELMGKIVEKLGEARYRILPGVRTRNTPDTVDELLKGELS